MKEVLEKSLLTKIERIEAFEERMKIRLENFSVRVNGDETLEIFFEVYPISGTTINETVEIQIVIYDKKGAILDTKETYLLESRFFGFEVIRFIFWPVVYLDKIGKIRIYPKKHD